MESKEGFGLVVETREGEVLEIRTQSGRSVMEAIRDAGIAEVLALCGGNCSCGTCHVYIDPRFVELLPRIGEDESDLLDMSQHRKENSRLSCQICMSDALAGLRVKIAPEG